MKVVLLFCVVVGTAVAAGSGPYNPRGWRPVGPAFTLPGEKEKLLIKEASQEVDDENAFKEYGLPKLEALKTEQGLPENQTERAFEAVAKLVEKSEKIFDKQESISNSAEDVTTTGLAVDEQDATTVPLESINEDTIDESPIVKITDSQISNMVDLLQMISEQNREEEADEKLKALDENSQSVEGFTEYGLPQFDEYGPPNELRPTPTP